MESVACKVVGLLDVDAFFAAAEVLRRPELAGVPLVVAYDHPRSVVSTASYEARAFSIRSALPLSRARALCPRLVVVEPDFAWYQELSLECFAAVAGMVDVIEPLSLDEALFPVPVELGEDPGRVESWLRSLQTEVWSRTGLSVSVGAGPSRTVAKLAATSAKPSGVRFVPSLGAGSFLASHRLGEVPGVGPASAAALAAAGFETVADVQTRGLGSLSGSLSRLLSGLLNYDSSPVVSLPTPAKSVSVVSTFPTDSSSFSILQEAFVSACGELYDRLVPVADAASTVSVRLRRPDFSEVSRSHSSSTPCASRDDLFSMLSVPFGELVSAHGWSFRSLGVSASKFSYLHPGSLFAAPSDRPHRWVPGELCTHPLFGSGMVILVAQDSLLVRFPSGRKVRVLHRSAVSPS